MATVYNTSIALTLTPQWHIDPPEIIVRANNQIQKMLLDHTQTFYFDFCSPPEDITISVELINKKDSDTVPEKNLDKAVIIDALSVNGISDVRFVWNGQYRPKYPEPWYSEQAIRPDAVLKNHNYLGWNGVWSIQIQVPAFLWMHQLLGLGWVYD